MPTDTLAERIASMKVAAEKATPGPWVTQEGNFITTKNYAIVAEVPCQGCNDNDVAYIAAVNPAAVLALIAHVGELEREVAELKGAAMDKLRARLSEEDFSAFCAALEVGPDGKPTIKLKPLIGARGDTKG